MHNSQKPDLADLPSTRQLLKSTGIAAIVAGALLVTVVLPAEYGVDPTGAGSVLGLTEMGRIKVSLAREAEAPGSIPTAGQPVEQPLVPDVAAVTDSQPLATPATPSPSSQAINAPEQAPAMAAPDPATQSDEMTFSLQPDEAFEIKLVMAGGATADFVWFTDGAKVNFDTHGDWPGTSYHNYNKGSANRAEGQLTAASTGSHGWFWRNRNEEPVTITLQTRGTYSDVKQIEE